MVFSACQSALPVKYHFLLAIPSFSQLDHFQIDDLALYAVWSPVLVHLLAQASGLEA